MVLSSSGNDGQTENALLPPGGYPFMPICTFLYIFFIKKLYIWYSQLECNCHSASFKFFRNVRIYMWWVKKWPFRVFIKGNLWSNASQPNAYRCWQIEKRGHNAVKVGNRSVGSCKSAIPVNPKWFTPSLGLVMVCHRWFRTTFLLQWGYIPPAGGSRNARGSPAGGSQDAVRSCDFRGAGSKGSRGSGVDIQQGQGK